jgi:hypothetical protein
MKDSFLSYEGSFHKQYGPLLGEDTHHRSFTMLTALNLFRQRKGKFIVETGCQRQLEDWGAGCSTQVFSEYIKQFGGKLQSFDINSVNVAFANMIINSNPNATITCIDSIEGLKTIEETIDLLYLDSFDYPYGTLLEYYGGKEDIHKAIETLGSMSEETILLKHREIVYECQEHCLKELYTALDCLSKDSLILIDDNNLPGGGKSRLANEWLEGSLDWELIYSGYQALWSHR